MQPSRLITILEAVAMAGRPISALDLHKTTKLPLPTCYRLLHTLSEQRILDRPDDKSLYVIGGRLMRIAQMSATDSDVSTVVSPALKEAAIELKAPVFLSRFRQSGVGIIHVETPSDPTISYMHPGLGYRPLHACACSKAIAAFADEKFQTKILKGAMKAYTDKTCTSAEELEIEFKNIRKNGFAECLEEIEVGVSSVAAPVQIERVGAIYSVGTTGPVRRLNPKYRKSLGKKLIVLAEEVGNSIQLNSSI